MKTQIKLIVTTLIHKIMELGCVDSQTELIILVLITLALSVLPGPNIIIPILYGRVKSFIQKIVKKKTVE